VPAGFATTAHAYRLFLEENGLEPDITRLLQHFHAGEASLQETGEAIRVCFLEAEFPVAIAEAIRSAYRELNQRAGAERLAVAVRSSATAEDLPDASFAG